MDCAGTDANVSVTVFGDKGRKDRDNGKERKLLSRGNGHIPTGEKFGAFEQVRKGPSRRVSGIYPTSGQMSHICVGDDEGRRQCFQMRRRT